MVRVSIAVRRRDKPNQMEMKMARMIGTFAVALALAAAFGTAFVSSASAKPKFGPSECVIDEGYGRYTTCNQGGGE